MSIYLFGLPSFVYQNPRFLDTYQHEGNAIALLFSKGWYSGPIWYVYQFPGAYTFFAQLTAVAGLDPFVVMQVFPMCLALVIALMLYALVRSISPSHAMVASAFILSGLWFQLHLSPQALELIMYLGVFLLLLKIIDDVPQRGKWEMIAMAVTPILVLSHPETPLVLLLGIAGFLVLQGLLARSRLSDLKLSLAAIGPFFAMLALITVSWWTSFASGALAVVQSIVNGALNSGISGLSHGAPAVPATPAPSYHVTILLQEGISATVWVIGLGLFVFVRRFKPREFLLMGMFLAAVSTIPVALFANADVLQRSYLFALFPLGILVASLSSNPAVLRIRGRSLLKPIGLMMFIVIVGFSVVMPVSRYGLDSFNYLSESSLVASNVAASETTHSVLMLHPGWYGWRYYAPYHGYEGAVLLEQKNITSLPGAYVKLNTYEQYNLTYSGADRTADYLFLSDYFQNLYVLRFGSNSTSYLQQKVAFEAQASFQFNLVYSSGTDRFYENRDLG
ncbi:MAG TPA: hypothetical protein VFJ63_00400 [Candidatus Bathyarchaeia archaeon]|nr:hypothetical protein [Candidatus Bathyarchaeia archaeon]